jgi:hypothetical protein
MSTSAADDGEAGIVGNDFSLPSFSSIVVVVAVPSIAPLPGLLSIFGACLRFADDFIDLSSEAVAADDGA